MRNRPRPYPQYGTGWYVDSFRVCVSEAAKGQAVALYLGIGEPPPRVLHCGKWWHLPAHTACPVHFVYYREFA